MLILSVVKELVMNLNYVVEQEISINQILNDKFEISTRLKNKLINKFHSLAF